MPMSPTPTTVQGAYPVASSNQLTLDSSERLSSGISLHTFSASGNSLQSFNASSHVDLLFLEDLDPTRPSQSDADRQLSFTPAYVRKCPGEATHQLIILARNGRVTQLLGLPRLHGPLKASITSSGGGFPEEALRDLEGTVCIASGTGLAPFLAVASRDYPIKGAHLLWTINGNDFGALEVLLSSNLLKPEQWSSVKVFITSGDEMQGLIAGKGTQWWQDRLGELQRRHGGDLAIKCGRMCQDDVLKTVSDKTSSVLFCGNKSLEWQVKMWFLNKAHVYTTSVD